MDWMLLLEYGWVLLLLIALEGLLAADNALVIAVMVKHLPEDERKRALFYGLGGAFFFRFGSLFLISFIAGVWQVQAVGALYLLFIATNHLLRKFVRYRAQTKEHKSTGSGFWSTVLKVELADIAFAVDSILAAVAMAVTLPTTSLPKIGGMDGGHFLVIFTGGLIGLVLMRFAAVLFVKLLERKPGLETAAYLIVGWVGVKLAVLTLAHKDIAVLPEWLPKLAGWKLSFYFIIVLIAVSGWFFSKNRSHQSSTHEVQQ